jgi:hypothetical protein
MKMIKNATVPFHVFTANPGIPALSNSCGTLADKTDAGRMTDIASKENTPGTFIVQDFRGT